MRKKCIGVLVAIVLALSMVHAETFTEKLDTSVDYINETISINEFVTGLGGNKAYLRIGDHDVFAHLVKGKVEAYETTFTPGTTFYYIPQDTFDGFYDTYVVLHIPITNEALNAYLDQVEVKTLTEDGVVSEDSVKLTALKELWQQKQGSVNTTIQEVFIEIDWETFNESDFEEYTIQNKEKIKNGFIGVIQRDITSQLVEEEYVLSVRSAESLKQYMHQRRERVQEEMKEREMDKKRGVSREDMEEPEDIEADTLEEYFTSFVVPNEVFAPTIATAYEKAVSMYYVSDELLWDTEEKWIHIRDLHTTETLMSPDGFKSDCEEHANYLCSLLRSAGVTQDDVRVVLGEIEAGDGAGGHAWVEIYRNGQWIALEPSCSDIITGEGVREVDPFTLWYFAKNPYPEIKRWIEYNDVYYKNYLNGEQTDLPMTWGDTNLGYSTGYSIEDINRMLIGAGIVLILTGVVLLVGKKRKKGWRR